MIDGMDVIRGLDFEPLPVGWTPIGAALLIKCLDAEGNASWSFRTSSELNDEETVGALLIRLRLQERDLLEAYTNVDEDDSDTAAC